MSARVGCFRLLENRQLSPPLPSTAKNSAPRSSLGNAEIARVVGAFGYSAAPLVRREIRRGRRPSNGQTESKSLIEYISLDGVIQGPKEDDYRYGGWAAPHDDPAGGEAIVAAHGDDFDLLLGRRTYDIWSGFWPTAPKSPLADAINSATKYIATHRPGSLAFACAQQNRKDEQQDFISKLGFEQHRASVELPQTIRCGPSIALTRRTPAPMSAPRPSAGPMPFLFGWNPPTRIRACQYEGCVLGRSILEARDLNHATQLVSQLPGFKHGLEPIEIRPTADLNELIKASEQRRRQKAAR